MIHALTCLVEGEATLVMFAEMMRGDEDPREALKLPPERMDLMFSALRSLSPFASGKTFQKAPLILKESLIFPYHKGTVFVLHLTNRSDWKLVDEAFRSPPVSTEQVLHPEKYYDPDRRDEPVELELPNVAGIVGGKWQRVGRGNVMGEFQTMVMLADGAKSMKSAQTAAAGWDGDRYEVFENDAKQLALAWLSTWDTPRDAEEFAAAYAERRTRQLAPPSKKSPGQAADSKKPAGKPASALARWEQDGRVYLVERRGTDVAVIEGFSAKATDEVLPALFKSKKSPKRFRPVDAKGQPKKAA
jgi:hypothetical protein